MFWRVVCGNWYFGFGFFHNQNERNLFSETVLFGNSRSFYKRNFVRFMIQLVLKDEKKRNNNDLYLFCVGRFFTYEHNYLVCIIYN